MFRSFPFHLDSHVYMNYRDNKGHPGPPCLIEILTFSEDYLMTPLNLTHYIPLVVDALQRLIPLIGDVKNREKREQLEEALERLNEGSEALRSWLVARERRMTLMMIILGLSLALSFVNLILLIHVTRTL